MHIKICGLTNQRDIAFCLECGVDYLGFIFYKKSHRYVDPDKVRLLLKQFDRTCFHAVGVFVNSSKKFIDECVERSTVDYVQLHGDESLSFASNLPYQTIKAIRLKTFEDMAVWKDYPFILLEGYSLLCYGGSGNVVDWDIASECRTSHRGEFFLSGGLHSNNVLDAIKKVMPDGVDVCSGVECSPGIKDPVKVKDFVTHVQTRRDH